MLALIRPLSNLLVLDTGQGDMNNYTVVYCVGPSFRYCLHDCLASLNVVCVKETITSIVLAITSDL